MPDSAGAAGERPPQMLSDLTSAEEENWGGEEGNHVPVRNHRVPVRC